MFASDFISRAGFPRAAIGLLMASFALFDATHALAGPVCRPVLAIKDVRFSPTQPETMERRWTALLSVDASRCATTSGRFEILFTRQKENGPEVDFAEPFTWTPDLVAVSVDFWADEAVEEYRLTNIAACPCRD